MAQTEFDLVLGGKVGILRTLQRLMHPSSYKVRSALQSPAIRNIDHRARAHNQAAYPVGRQTT